MKQEGRHIDYYLTQARERLEHPRAQKVTRGMITRMWEPVGAQVMPVEETQHLVRTLFSGSAEGREVAARVDRRVDALPGLEGLGLMAGAVATYG